MKRRITLFFASLGLTMLLLAPAAPASAAYNPFGDVCKEPGANKSAACQQDGSDPVSGKNGILYKAGLMVSRLAGAIAIILLIVAGLSYVTSGGDSGKVGNAKKTIIYTVIGLLVIACAQTIILFVVGRL